LIFAQHVAIGDTEQKGIADLACGAGYSYAHRGFRHDASPKWCENDVQTIAATAKPTL
jgi:hypothetical protein